MWAFLGIFKTLISVVGFKWIRKLLVVVFFASSLFPDAASATMVENVKCVQWQLNAAGFDAGPVDGQLRPELQTALDEFQDSEGFISTRKISYLTSSIFCRKIGVFRPALARYWPSRINSHAEAYMGAEFDPQDVEEMNEYLNRIYQDIEQLFDIKLAGRDQFFMARSAQEVLELQLATGHCSRDEFEWYLPDQCTAEDQFLHHALAGIGVTCLERSYLDLPRADYMLVNTAISQVVSLVQFQLTGGSQQSWEESTQPDIAGPLWLRTGITIRLCIRENYSVEMIEVQKLLFRHYQGEVPDLENTEFAIELSEVEQFGSFVAVNDLIELVGYPAISKIYENIGAGHDWPTAFEMATGFSTSVFYRLSRTAERDSKTGLLKSNAGLQP